METEFEVTKTNIQKQTEEVRKKEEFLQTISTGIAGNEGRDNGYADQIQGAYLICKHIT